MRAFWLLAVFCYPAILCANGPNIRLTVNGFAQSAEIASGDTVSVVVSLDTAGSEASADWWLAYYTSAGEWFYYDLSNGWTGIGTALEDLEPTYQGPLFDLPSFAIPQEPVLPAGKNTLYFALDLTPNGILDIDQLYYASTDISVSPPDGPAGTLRVYVAGESIEEFNYFVDPPFNPDGTLNDLGNANNNDFEYGWMIPFADRLYLRNPMLELEWVGSGSWITWDWEDSVDTYSRYTPGRTSAVAGTSVADWLEYRRGELEQQDYCYHVAFASRGGNDLNNDLPQEQFESDLRDLVFLLDRGSSCREHPLIVVTAHMPDEGARWAVEDWMGRENEYYLGSVNSVVSSLEQDHPEIRARVIDMFTPFITNLPTTAFPAPEWTANGYPDLELIHRDGQHPKRLASIYAGEIVADQMDLAELSSLLGD